MAAFKTTTEAFDIDVLRNDPERAVQIAVAECALGNIRNRNVRSAVARLNRVSKKSKNAYLQGMCEVERVAAKNTVFEMFLVLIQNGKYVLRDWETIEEEYKAYKANLSEKRRLASANALAAKKAKAAEEEAIIEEAEGIVALAVYQEDTLVAKAA